MGKPRAVSCHIDGDSLVVTLADGRQVRSELALYPRLRSATRPQLSNWRLVGRGLGLHWPEIDEDLSVDGLLRDGKVIGALGGLHLARHASFARLNARTIANVVSVTSRDYKVEAMRRGPSTNTVGVSSRITSESIATLMPWLVDDAAGQRAASTIVSSTFLSWNMTARQLSA